MKKLLFALFIICTSCAEKCDMNQIESNYIKALQNTGGSAEAIKEITRQYNARRAECN